VSVLIQIQGCVGHHTKSIKFDDNLRVYGVVEGECSGMVMKS